MNVPKFFISRLDSRKSQTFLNCFVFKRKVSHFREISRNSRKSKWTRASSQNARYLCLWEGWETGINQKALKPFECTFGSLEGLERLACFCWHKLHIALGLKFIRRAFSGVNLAFGMLTRECFLECTFNWLDYSTGIKDETQTHCFTGFSRMVSLVIPNVGFASLLTQSPHLILGCAWTAATLLMALQGLVCPVEV